MNLIKIEESEKMEKVLKRKLIKKEDELTLIPKTEKYIEYMLSVILKIPRVEKFSIGNEYKNSMYKMLENILYLNKTDTYRVKLLNKIDADLSVQRIFLRIMYKNTWIDRKKFDYSMSLIYEIGKIIGGLIKYYGKNN